ncbi:MAG: hypothetical protein E5V21_27215, partial [Mesorhizobium sp.]
WSQRCSCWSRPQRRCGVRRGPCSRGATRLIETFNPLAVKVYERRGYRPFGVLPDLPVGRSRVFLQKNCRLD